METILYLLALAAVALGVVFLFSLTVFVHELGHFLVAKALGLKIDAFAIGFGKPLWQKTINGISYRIGFLPLGGYVALPQMDPTGSQTRIETGSQDTSSVQPIAAWKKIPVALAGAVMNILLAFLIAVVIWKVGIRQSIYKEPSIIGYVAPDNATSPANQLAVGERILKVNGESVRNWEDVMIEVALGARALLELENPTAGTLRVIELAPKKSEEDGQHYIDEIGPSPAPLVRAVLPGSAAEQAGLQANDLIVSVDGIPVLTREELSRIVTKSEGAGLRVGFLRQGEKREVVLAPRWTETENRWLIGISYAYKAHPHPIDQMKTFSGAIFRTLKAFSRPYERKQAVEGISGPVGIFHLLGVVLSNGIMQALYITALINVNLAIFNLLPFPILDGGHICFALYEMIFRRPPPERAVRPLVYGALFSILCMVLFLTYRDSSRIKRWHFPDKEAPAAVESAPSSDAPEQAPAPASP